VVEGGGGAIYASDGDEFKGAGAGTSLHADQHGQLGVNILESRAVDGLGFAEYRHLAEESRTPAQRKGGRLEEDWLKELGIHRLDADYGFCDTNSQERALVMDATGSRSDMEIAAINPGSELGKNVTVEDHWATARLNCFATFTVDARSTLAEYLRRVIFIVYDAIAPPSFEGAVEEFLFW
jgi:hypothetical protein